MATEILSETRESIERRKESGQDPENVEIARCVGEGTSQASQAGEEP